LAISLLEKYLQRVPEHGVPEHACQKTSPLASASAFRFAETLEELMALSNHDPLGLADVRLARNCLGIALARKPWNNAQRMKVHP
jgi:hypothetical protein